MKIEMKTLPRATLEEFADQHGLVMEVNEREKIHWAHPDGFKPFYAYFKNAKIKDGVCLASVFGDGVTPEDAIADYGRHISGQLLILNAYSSELKEIRVPYITQ